YVWPSILTIESPYVNAPPLLNVIITNAVIVQMTPVSMKGSSNETKPSDAAYLVLTAEWAIEAEPAPASFEKAARLKPTTNTPTSPPSPACGLKASLIIKDMASSIKDM